LESSINRQNMVKDIDEKMMNCDDETGRRK